MPRTSLKQRWRRGLKVTGNAIGGALAIGVIKLMRLARQDTMSNLAGSFMRRIGPLFPEHKIGRANLTAAFPEKTPAEIDKILLGVWENLGRVGAEFTQLDRLIEFNRQHPELGRLHIPPSLFNRFLELANDGKPALVFTAHLANWELPAVFAASQGLDSAALYRRPNMPAIDRWVRETRAASMGELIATGLDAPVRIADALKRGAHIGMLVDQYYVRGVEVTFFGRKTNANPLIARLAQHFDCPIVGVRVIRLPNNRFTAELTDEIKPVRDAKGDVDIAATMQVITTIIEGWVREHPEQWLWLHRRWR
ncbi:lipid A biosynthesis lauroyl acyltransferase [Pseudolabrys sp. Root1462]|uniref:lipid A biosynthesis lauroyl acyltransferase n=1 Tax=Pseudolabrys sp. Root1462 TaxID=1736466 RepID=UPI00070392A2|nr:lipid A biosynthesis lauroyl acyltransferase [Pseudolabrys sp. Root1462]KQZ01375.1 lipid A biosynthesis lauroyl acyltransferase [Pseudolabrys sp. Root1462]